MAPFWFLLYSQSLTSDKLPKWPGTTEDKMSRPNLPCPKRLQAIVCLFVRLRRYQQPLLPPTLFSNKVHSVVWGDFEKPGHPAGRPHPNQRGPSLAPDYRCGLFTSAHPALPRNVCLRVYACTCTPSGSSRLITVPFTNTTRSWLSKVGSGCRGSYWPCS